MWTRPDFNNLLPSLLLSSFHRSALWTTDVSLLLPNGWWSSCLPSTSVSFPHARSEPPPSPQVIPSFLIPWVCCLIMCRALFMEIVKIRWVGSAEVCLVFHIQMRRGRFSRVTIFQQVSIKNIHGWCMYVRAILVFLITFWIIYCSKVA